MDQWKELMEGHAFITDLGRPQEVEVEGKRNILGRYAVWSPLQSGTGHTVVEVGSDLGELMNRYGISDSRVCTLVSG